MTLLYIDPGTGSALFSIVIGLATTVFFLAKHWWIRIKAALGSGRSEAELALSSSRERIVIYSEGARYWNVFKPVVDELERRGHSALYLTSDQNDPALASELSHVRQRFIGKGNTAYARLNVLEADILLMTTPGLDVYQLKRSKGVSHYAHLLHAVDDATSYRLFGLDYFDSVLLSGAYQSSAIRELEGLRRLSPKELVVVGSTYLDVFASKVAVLDKRNEGITTVLLSPSWGESGLLQRYGLSLLKPLADSGLRIIIRPHPQSLVSEAAMIADLQSALSTYAMIEWDFERENLGALSRADVMISDFSGIVFDYAFLFGRPVLYVLQDFDIRPYDASDVKARPWKFEALSQIGRELSPADFPHIGQIVVDLCSDESRTTAIAVARDEAWQHRGQSGARVVDFLLEHCS